MRLVEFVLQKVKDDKHLIDQLSKSEAIRDLVTGYNRLALQPVRSSDRADDVTNGLYAVTGETYGIDLKRYISYLPSADQLRLLNQYLSHFPQADKGNIQREDDDEDTDSDTDDDHPKSKSETAAERDERKLRHWAVKVVIYFCMFFATLVIGAMIAVMYRDNDMPDSALLQTIMETATEVIKILFSTAK